MNFESKIKKTVVPKGKTWSFKFELTEKSYFGGILIRQIQRLSDKVVFDGPFKVAELFRTLDATSPEQANPILEMKELDTIDFKKPERRHNLLGNHKGDIKERAKAKADYNLQECFVDVSDSQKRKLGVELAAFYGSEYRYCWKTNS